MDIDKDIERCKNLECKRNQQNLFKNDAGVIFISESDFEECEHWKE